MKKKSVLIVDVQTISRFGLYEIIKTQDDLELFEETNSGKEAMSLMKGIRPDIVILDLSLKDMPGIELIHTIREQFPSLPILVFSMYEETEHAEALLRIGVRGYVMKSEPPDEIIFAIRGVLSNNIYVSDRLKEWLSLKLIKNPPTGEDMLVDTLSPRDLEVFKLLGQGFRPSQIGAQLGLSVQTIESHRSKIKLKLNVKSAADLAQFAIRWTRKDKTS